MKKTVASVLGFAGVALLLTGCDGGMLDLPGSVVSVSGTVQLRTSNGDIVTLNSASVGRTASASFYDNNGQGEFSMRIADEVDPLIFELDQKTSDLATELNAVNVHATSSNMQATIDLTAGQSVNVNQQWDAVGQCIYWQGNVDVCTRDPKTGQTTCTEQLQTVYGTANFHYVKSGVIYHDELKITPQSGSVVFDLVNDQTSTTSTQTSPCVKS
jgi:hypothetical protein